MLFFTRKIIFSVYEPSETSQKNPSVDGGVYLMRAINNLSIRLIGINNGL